MPDKIENFTSNIKQVIREKNDIRRKLKIGNAEDLQIKRLRRTALLEKKIEAEEERADILEAAEEKAQAEAAFDAAVALEQSEGENVEKSESSADISDNAADIATLQQEMAMERMIENLFKPMGADAYRIDESGKFVRSDDEQMKLGEALAIEEDLIEAGDVEGAKQVRETFGERNKEAKSTLYEARDNNKARIQQEVENSEIDYDLVRNMPAVSAASVEGIIDDREYMKSDIEYRYKKTMEKIAADPIKAREFGGAEKIRADLQEREKLIDQQAEAQREIMKEDAREKNGVTKVVGKRASELDRLDYRSKSVVGKNPTTRKIAQSDNPVVAYSAPRAPQRVTGEIQYPLNRSVNSNAAFPTETPTKLDAVRRQVVAQKLTATKANVGVR